MVNLQPESGMNSAELGDLLRSDREERIDTVREIEHDIKKWEKQVLEDREQEHKLNEKINLLQEHLRCELVTLSLLKEHMQDGNKSKTLDRELSQSERKIKQIENQIKKLEIELTRIDLKILKQTDLILQLKHDAGHINSVNN